MGRRDTVLATLVVTTWGLNYVAIKLGVAELPPLLMTTLRFVLVALLALPFAPPKRAHIKPLLILSFTMGSLHFGILFLGMVHVDAATSAIALQTSVPFSVLIGALIFHERIGMRRIAGIALGFAGIVVLAGAPSSPDLTSLALIVFAAFCWAASSALFKIMPAIPSLTYIGGTAAFAAPQTLIASLLLEDHQITAMQDATLLGWGAMIFTAIGASLIGHGLWYGLVKRHDLSLVVPFTLLGPVIGVVAAVVLLDEPMSVEKLIGACLTMAGVAVIQIAWPRRRSRAL
ncbi:MAG: EamA family transporter [Rhodospirillaceae bacterium]|nr:EamA family transporter [Rhodospirillaceae bacterium]